MTIRFCWVTDTHTTTADGRLQGLLQSACDYADNNSLDYIVNTGDIGNDAADNAIVAMDIMNAASTPLLWCNGNHSEEENPVGAPSTSAFEVAKLWNMPAPFYHTQTITGSVGEVARVLMMDANIYDDSPENDLDSPNHNPGDRVGFHNTAPSGDWWRQFGTNQLSWVTSTLSGDSTSDYIIVLNHYPPVGQTQTDYQALADAITADGRPSLWMCGHVHPSALSSYSIGAHTVYKCPALRESGSFCEWVIGWTGSAITITSATVRNYFSPDPSWIFEQPFTLESGTLRLLAGQ